MHKQSCTSIALGMLLTLAFVPAHSQVWGIRVRTPFKFVVANQTLPQGEYLLSAYM